MKFTTRVEGYAGTKEYDNILNFAKTIESFLRGSKEGEVIKFTLFDIKEQEVCKMVEDKIDKEESKEEMILRILKETELDWISAQDMHETYEVGISLKRLYYYLNILRKEESLYYKKNSKGNLVYRSKSKKVTNGDTEVEEEIDSIKVIGGKIDSIEETDNIEKVDISVETLIKLHNIGYLSDKGVKVLIKLLLAGQ